MSSSQQDDSAAVIQSFITENYIDYALLALVVYEYAVTLQQEITLIWQRKWTAPTVLFIFNRYLMLVYSILLCIPTSSLTGCNIVERLIEATETLQLTIYALFSALRVFALWNQNIWIMLPVLALSIVPVATNIYYYRMLEPIFIDTPIPACNLTTNLSDDVISQLVQATRIPVIIADALVLALTWMKTFGQMREARHLKMSAPFTAMIFRDGTVYFSCLLIMNILQILFETTVFLPAGTFINALTPILISRFLLNLRQLDEHRNGTETGNQSFQFSIVFAGNIGEPLTHSLLSDDEKSALQPHVDDASSEENSTESPSSSGSGGTPIWESQEIQEIAWDHIV